MKDFFYVFILAFLYNIDNIGVRITYSLRGIKVDVLKNMVIAALTFIISTTVALFGNLILKMISINICNILIMFMFTIFGLYCIFEPHIKKKKTNEYNDIITSPNNADINDSKSIELKEAIFLGIALNINNIGGCFSAGMLGLNNYLIGGLSALFSFLTFWLGNYLVPTFRKLKILKRMNLIAGFLFIAIGIKQIL